MIPGVVRTTFGDKQPWLNQRMDNALQIGPIRDEVLLDKESQEIFEMQGNVKFSSQEEAVKVKNGYLKLWCRWQVLMLVLRVVMMMMMRRRREEDGDEGGWR